MRAYRVVHFKLQRWQAPAVKVYTPNAENCLHFYGRRADVSEYPDGRRLSWDSVLTGAHDVTVRRWVPDEFLLVQVVLEPGALYSLTGIPGVELHNQYLDAESLFGTGVRRTTERIADALGYAEMVRHADDFIRECLARRKPARSVLRPLRALRDDPTATVESMADASAMSLRQFERVCLERTGLGPKEFACLSRFDRAFHGKLQHPDLDWLSIALACGYHDYQHMAREFRGFTGMTPPRLLETQRSAPETLLGVRQEFDLTYSLSDS